MREEIFVDTAYLVAIVDPTDGLHEAVTTVTRTLALGTRFVTTAAVLTELLGYFAASRPLRTAGLRAVDRVRQSRAFLVVDFSPREFEAALGFYRNRPDKAYSLVDCHSMVVMRRRSITRVLTTDRHFLQEGFTCLLPTAARGVRSTSTR